MKRIVLGAVVAALATPTLALDFGNGFSLVGEIALENVDTDSGGNGFAIVDATGSWRSQGGSGLGFGADLTVEALRIFDESETVSTLWGGLVLTTGFGEFTLGAPRPILIDFLATPDLAGSRALEYDFSEGQIGASLTASQVLLSSADPQSYGASFKGSAGAFDYGVALHRVDFGSVTVDVLELGARYRIDQLTLTAGAELRDPSNSSTNQDLLTLGALYDAEGWSIGAQARQASAGGDTRTSLRVYGDFAVTEALTIHAQAVDAETLGDTLFGLSAEYRAGAGFASLGYLTDSGDGSTEALIANIGLRF